MTSHAIRSVKARRVWDSRAHPTIEVDVVLEGGHRGRAIAPAGASRGRREAVDLRDGGNALKGLGVEAAIRAIDEVIAPALAGFDAADQAAIDRALVDLDGTPDKSRLGGNALVATSLAVLWAAAAAAGRPLWRHVAELYGESPSIPLPEIQIFGGGAHAGRRIDIQDFMVMVPGAASFSEALEVTAEIYHAAGSLMARKGLAGVADEGGWWPDFRANEEALETLVRAIELAGEKPGGRVVIALDVAASEFGTAGRYRLALEERDLDTGAMIALIGGWLEAYPVASVEDPLAEDDAGGMRAFTEAHGGRVQIVGDDYLVTSAGLVEEAARAGACNAVLVKVNQAGTVSEAVAAFRAARAAGWRSVVSARSGESEDTSIAHLAVGLGCGQLKVGSMARSERTAKWNAGLRIEEEAGSGRFAAGAALARTWWGEPKPARATGDPARRR